MCYDCVMKGRDSFLSNNKTLFENSMILKTMKKNWEIIENNDSFLFTSTVPAQMF